MMKWSHKMIELCLCQVRGWGIPWKTFPDTKVQHSSKCFPTLVQCHCFSQWTKCWGGPLRSLLLLLEEWYWFKKKVGHNLAYNAMLKVGRCLWPSHGCAWCWRTSPHHPTPSSSSSCIANLNGLLSNPLNLTFVKVCSFCSSLSSSIEPS